MSNIAEVLKVLKSLMQLDVDAVHAYNQAIEKIDVPAVREALEQFRGDHERHITDLSRAIGDLGGDAPRPTPDLKGFLITGITALRSLSGTEGALKAMRKNEVATNDHYHAAATHMLPDDIMRLVQRNWNDESKHLRYIEKALEERVWEQRRKKGASMSHGKQTSTTGPSSGL